MNETKINWTGFTWNPASGCTKVSAECKYCYAETLAENKRGSRAFPNGFDITLRPHKLAEPARVKKPSLIFTNSMTDMFHADIPDSYRDDIHEAMARAPQHRYQVLTKRPNIARRYYAGGRLPEHIWLGVTVGVNETLWRVDELRAIDVAVRFLSCEPLLEQLAADLSGISWVIGGGESGSHLSKDAVREARGLVRRGRQHPPDERAWSRSDRNTSEPLWVPREDRIDWARALRDETKAVGAAFWWKQWGGPRPESGGRLLDGRTWDELPIHIPGAMPAAYEHRARHLPLVPSNTSAV